MITPAQAEDAEASVPYDSWCSRQLTSYIRSVQYPTTGLPQSFVHSADPALNHVTFTYDAAVSALVLAHARKFEAAKNALSTYLEMPLPSRYANYFNTAYQIENQQPTLEYRLHGGPVFWVAIALMRYGQATGDKRAQEKGIKLLEWARTNLPHFHGGVAMSHKQDMWGHVMSVETNWVYYGALRIAGQLLPDGRQRTLFLNERKDVLRWLRSLGSNRGIGDATVSDVPDPARGLDVYTHQLLVGPDAYLQDGVFPDAEALNRWARRHIQELDALFQIPGTALYDYTDEQGAQDAQRPRKGWLEGTEQVSLAYRTWAPWFEQQGDAVFAKDLRMKAALSHAEVLQYSRVEPIGLAIPNTNAEQPFLTFRDGWLARPRTEAALNGTNWAYLGEVGYNPFTMELLRPKSDRKASSIVVANASRSHR